MQAVLSRAVVAASLALPAVAAPGAGDDASWQQHMHRAVAARAAGRPADAAKHLGPALKEAERFPAPDPRLAITLATLADTYDALERFADAEPLYRRAIGVFEAAASGGHPALAELFEKHAADLRRLNRRAEADVAAARAAKIAGDLAAAQAKDAAGPTYRGRSVGEWTRALASPNRMQAMQTLQDGDQEAVPVLVELARSEVSAVRVTAVGGLAEVGAGAKDALPALAAALKDRDLNVRYYAASALRKMGAVAAPAVSPLIEALSTHPGTEPGLEGPLRYYKDARSVAAEALGRIGPGARAAVPRLRELAAKDDEPDVRRAAAEALRTIEGN